MNTPKVLILIPHSARKQCMHTMLYTLSSYKAVVTNVLACSHPLMHPTETNHHQYSFGVVPLATLFTPVQLPPTVKKHNRQLLCSMSGNDTGKCGQTEPSEFVTVSNTYHGTHCHLMHC